MTQPVLTSLRQSLTEWADTDYAIYYCAVSLGIVAPGVPFLSIKSLAWSNNPLGNAMYDFLERLIQIGVLEKREAPSDTQYRWNPQFKAYWES